MTKKEELIAAKAAIEALVPDIEAGNDEALKKGAELKATIETLEADIAKDEAKAALLGSIGSSTTTESEEKSMKNPITEFTKKAAEVDRSQKGWGVSMTLSKAATDVVTGVQIADVDKTVAGVPSRSAAKDLFMKATISGNAVTYFTEDAYEGTPGVVSEGAKKPQNSVGFTPHTLALSKIAAYIKETDEIVTDAPFLATEVENSLVYKVGLKEDDHVIGAIAGTSGILAGTYGAGSSCVAATLEDGVLFAARKIKSESGYDATCVIINPLDMFTLLTKKDQNQQYLGGGFFVGAYGNGGLKVPSAIWNLPVFESNAVAQGTVLVAAKQAVSVWEKGDIAVKLYEQNEDDAVKNCVTLLGEERIAAAVKNYNGVYKLTAAV